MGIVLRTKPQGPAVTISEENMNEHSKSPRMGAPKIPPNSVRDFCGIGLWTVMDSAGFFATGSDKIC